MNIESVKSLFTLFSGEGDCDKYAPFIDLAVSETERMLLPDADTSDIRLDFLSAAIANHRLQQINSARDRTRVTYSGKMLKESDNSFLACSERLLHDYIGLCSDLIRPQSFTFIGFSAKGEV